MSVSETGYTLEAEDGYSVMSFCPELADSQWANIEHAGTDLIHQLTDQQVNAVVIDLSKLDYIGSSMVALLVRIWKSVSSRGGHIVVVNTSETIYQVLDLAGLTKLWTVSPSYYAAVHHLGFSPKAKVTQRETRLLETTGVLAVITAAVGLVGLFLPIPDAMQAMRPWATIGLALLALITGSLSVGRTTGRGRIVCVLAAIAGVVILAVAIRQTWFRTVPTPLAEDQVAVTTTKTGVS